MSIKKKINPLSLVKEPPILLQWMKDLKTTGPMIKRIRVGIVSTVWNIKSVDLFVDGLTKGLHKQGVTQITRYEVPGTLEIPKKCLSVAQSRSVDVIIAVGVIIKGETYHFEAVIDSAMRSLMDIQLKSGIPIIDAILPCYTNQQVVDRVGPDSVEVQSLPLSTISVALDYMGYDNGVSVESK